MSEDSVVIAVAGNVVSPAAVAKQLGVPERKLLEAIRAAGSGNESGVEAFYMDWLQGRLPVGVMPCRSTSLYKLYTWWSEQKGFRVLSQVMLMRTMPLGLSKVRRTVKMGVAVKTYTFIEPDSWRPDQDRTLSDELVEHEAEFSRQLASLKG